MRRGNTPFFVAGAILLMSFIGMGWQAQTVGAEPNQIQQQFVQVCQWLIVGSFGFMFGHGFRKDGDFRNPPP